MERLDKEASRQRWRELRDKWIKYDPIGVMDSFDWPRDEYDAYVGPTKPTWRRQLLHVQDARDFLIRKLRQFPDEFHQGRIGLPGSWRRSLLYLD